MSSASIRDEIKNIMGKWGEIIALRFRFNNFDGNFLTIGLLKIDFSGESSNGAKGEIDY